MLLAYVFRVGNEAVPELCLLASKPDQFSVPVNVFSLPVTSSAVVRLGSFEAVVMIVEPSDSSRIILPVKPSKLFLTPSQPDRPGEQVVRVRILKRSEKNVEVYFQREPDVERNEWKPWNPNAMSGLQ